MLEKEKFLDIKKLARAIRRENEDLFESLNKIPLEDAIKEKEEFIESVINNMGIRFSLGEQGKEEKQIFRANILIPDDIEFFQTYSRDKNIRNLMNHYLVNIEDIMSKITELNIYGKYINMSGPDDEEGKFVEEMTKENDVASDALDLLDEIKSLTNDIDNTLGNIETEEESIDVFTSPLNKVDFLTDEVEKEISLLEPEVIPSVESEVKTEEADLSDMSQAVSSFVDKYNELKSENERMIREINDLRSQISSLNDIVASKEAKTLAAEKENAELKTRNEKLESQVVESKALISKIYSCISPKE